MNTSFLVDLIFNMIDQFLRISWLTFFNFQNDGTGGWIGLEN